MALRDYARKRRSGTPEPSGSKARRGSRPIYVVQLHHARNRHYDFRLEVDGALKSWAVPKGPSLRPGERRLAVEVEDHPLDYADFEGDIPEGHYGAGNVVVFDRGHWACDVDPLHALAAGKLDFNLIGGRLGGGWKLVRTSRRGKQPQWLLIKRNDSHAADLEADDLLEGGGKHPGNVDGDSIAGRTATAAPAPAPAPAPAKAKAKRRQSEWHRRAAKLDGARDGEMPFGFEPMLTVLRAAPPRGTDWLHELKWDGYRLLTELVDGRASLRSRNGLDWTGTFAEIARAIESLPVRTAFLDGELVVLQADGRSDFSELQRVIEGGSTAPLRYLLFDLPGLAGVDLRQATLEARKALLSELLGDGGGTLAYSDHVRGHGAKVFAGTAEAGFEGVVSKRADSRYRAGRSGDWVKSKHVHSDEFLVVGHTSPKGSRKGFGALLLASRRRGRLVYMGRVGTGFSARTLASLHGKLRRLHADAAPVQLPAHVPLPLRNVHWVQPRIVVEVAYRGIGKEGLLRQASFLRVREDKEPADVEQQPEAPATPTTEVSMKISHPDRRMFADADYTKQDVADYYRAVADWILPELSGRPLSLLRCPDGSTGECFFQKHYGSGLGEHVHPVPLEQKSGVEDYLYVDSVEGLLELVQMNTIELHPWGARAGAPESPDRIVFDLDPGEGVDWKEVVSAAREVRDNLESVGLQGFVRLSGGKGLHVVVPLRRGPGWDEVRGFSEGFATAMATQSPTRYLATMARSKRKGRIFIDWLRNARGATSVASWSLRARSGAPVAMPLRWDELGRVTGPAAYDLDRARRRAASLRSDPWDGLSQLRQALPDL